MSSNKLSKRLEEKDKKANKELFELKRENMQLRRAVSRLQKQIAKILEAWGSGPTYKDEERADLQIQIPKESSNNCPSCNQDTLKKLSIGAKKIVVCSNCRHRGLVNE